MGWNIQSVKHRKASRMHHVPKIYETELLWNTLMLQKYFDLNYSWSQVHTNFLSLLEPLDLGAFDKKQLKDKEIKKPIEETKNGKKLPPLHPTAPAWDEYPTSHLQGLA